MYITRKGCYKDTMKITIRFISGLLFGAFLVTACAEDDTPPCAFAGGAGASSLGFDEGEDFESNADDVEEENYPVCTIQNGCLPSPPPTPAPAPPYNPPPPPCCPH